MSLAGGIVEALDIVGMEARIFETGNDGEGRGDADTIIPGDILAGSQTLSDRLQEWAGEASLSWDATNDDYKGVVTSNDRVEIVYRVTDPEADQSGSGASYSNASFSEASYAGTDVTVNSWTGQAHSPSFEAHSGPYHEGQRVTQYDIDLTEWVFGVLSDRTAYGAFEGTVSEIVREAVLVNAPEIDLSGVEDIDIETDQEYDGTQLNEIVTEMANIANAVVRSDGQTLIFEPLGEISPQFTLTDSDFGGLSSDSDDSSLVTAVRVDGSTDINVDEQTGGEDDVESYYTVTENDRLTYELDPEKNRLDRVDVWVRNAGTEESVNVRIQAPNPDGTGPRAINDETVDIVDDSSGVALPDDGFRNRFRLSREPLPPRPWLIIESGGVDGQDIGLNADGDPIFRTHYPYQIAVQVDSRSLGSDALDRYGLVEKTYTDDSLARFESARDVGEASLARNQYPDIDLAIEAMSRRAHDLSVGDVVSVELGEYGEEYVGEYIVMERDLEIASTNGRTTLSLQSTASL